MLKAQAYPTCSAVPPMLRMINGMAVHSTLRLIAIANAAPYKGQTFARARRTHVQNAFFITECRKGQHCTAMDRYRNSTTVELLLFWCKSILCNRYQHVLSKDRKAAETVQTTQELLQKATKQDRPFFVKVGFFEVHRPFTAVGNVAFY